jgi:thiamine-phosphate diphosphorylase
MSAPRRPLLMLVTDSATAKLPLPDLTVLAIAGGVDLVQVREKSLPELEVSLLVAAILDRGVPPENLTVNGRLGVAAAFGIGLHLPESTPWPATRPDGIGTWSRSVHVPASAARSCGADLVVAGHLFVTRSKPGLPPIGLHGLREIVAAAPCPVVAIGGIHTGNARAAISAGAAGVAVISAINDADDPENAARALRRAMESEEHG